jgi:glutathione synthase/RimK-type ligase-like ATP-grasp enzyme
MKKLLLLTDEQSEFLVSRADVKGYTSMDVSKIKGYFVSRGYSVRICKFSDLDLTENFKGIFILYQSSETQGGFYKRYIENLIYHLEKQGAIALPNHEFLKAHHDKVFMEFLRSGFTDDSLKTIKSFCYGSWVDARNYNSGFPVVIKIASGSGSSGVYLAKNKVEYDQLVKEAGKLLIAKGLIDLLTGYFKKAAKRMIKYLYPSKKKYYWKYNTTPDSIPIVVQTFVEGLSGDYKVLIFGKKYFLLYRSNRENDFRASGSGKFYDVPEKDHEGLLSYARKINTEIDFPIIGMDIGFDGKEYHLIEFQMIDIGTSALQRSDYWHEFHDGKWIRYDGKSDLEEEFSGSIYDYIEFNHR